MLLKNNKITKEKDFDNVFKNGKSNYNKFLGVKALKNALNINRFGVVVSNKISKKAVERNKIKRQIRNIVKTENKKLKKGFDIVIVALSSIKEQDYSNINTSLINSFNKLRLY